MKEKRKLHQGKEIRTARVSIQKSALQIGCKVGHQDFEIGERHGSCVGANHVDILGEGLPDKGYI